ncbi:hypothetical protein J421_4922 (plasmid) [Gemmatirosa kalamazoonensis]|uniref:Fibronectin type-III domain-containing protein n=1 Tax=Gemmatirosa kalamazoonensis TaxID=861299 RepID=W0RPN9_9BACT|nr:hypothetical protein [Gemmatirosa kalamazoonensis]AHG92457.1 hypothetical protein J421_4922 [Gemmatirosa kalamazoonensis]
MQQSTRLLALAPALAVLAVACGPDAAPTTSPAHLPGLPSFSTSAPAAPTPLSPADGAGVTAPLTISWSATIDPAATNGGYNWQVSTSPTFATIAAANSTNPQTTQAVVSGLPNGTYYWRVDAASPVFTDGVSAWSATRSFIVTGTGAGAPATPTLLPTQGYSTFHPEEVIRFHWRPATGAVTYRLEVSSDATFPATVTAGAVSFAIDNVPDTTYGFQWGTSLGQGRFFARVFAVSADNPQTGVRSLPSNTIDFTVSYTNPIGPPPVLTAPADGAAVTLPFTLTWADVPNPQPSGYEVQIAADPSFAVNEAVLGAQLTNPRFDVLSLTAGKKFWRVRSAQGMASSTTVAMTAWSTVRTFTLSTAPATPVSITPVKTPLYSGDVTFVQVQLSAGVPAGGATLTLASSNPAVLPVPATLAVPGTFGLVQFQTTAGQVTAPTPVTLTATLNGVSTSNAVTVLPPSLQSLTVSSPNVSGGMPAGATLLLNGVAPTGGAVVALTSSTAAALPPSTVTVPAGSASVPVSIPTSDVATSTPATITASWNGTSVHTQLTVSPSPAPTSLTLTPTSFVGGGPGSVDGLVTIAAASPFDQTLRVTSDNPTVLPFLSSATVIPAGTTRGSILVLPAAVSTTTVVTISVTGGGVTRSAALTVTPAATTPPPTPTAPTLLSPAVDATPAQPVRFDWSDVTGAARYVIEIDDENTFAAPLVTSATVTTSAATLGGLPARRLWWRVRAQNSAGTFGPYAAARRFTPLAATTTTTAALASVAVSPTSVTGGGTPNGTVALTAAAPSGGIVVTLSDNSAAASVPTSVTVPAGATSATFAISTSAVAGATSVTITATAGGVTRTATLTVNPPGTALTAPSLVSPAADQRFTLGQSITFDWSDVSGAASYTIEIDDDDKFPAPAVLSQTVTASQLTTAALPARTMWYRVRANSASGGAGPWSAARRFEVR